MRRTVNLGQQIDGINLMRWKGGASPSGLFDLVNGWVTPKGTVQSRAGSLYHVPIPTGGGGAITCVGLVGFAGKLHTFCHTYIAPTSDVIVNVLLHPTGAAATLALIHAAFPFLGRLYVVAQFSDGVVKHYWLDAPPVWAANTAVNLGDQRQASTLDGVYWEVTGYVAGGTVQPLPIAWQTNKTKALNDIVQPTEYNGFKYTATVFTGTGPHRTGNTEPTWPVVDGVSVTERRYVSEEQESSEPETRPTPTPVPPREEYGPYPPPRERGPPTVIE